MDKNENQERTSNEVKFITSLSLAVNDMDDVVRHIQIVIAQNVETKQFNAYFDVVDPSKIKLAE